MKISVCFIAFMLALASISFGSPISISTYDQSCFTSSDFTSCGYSGTWRNEDSSVDGFLTKYSDGSVMGQSTRTDSLSRESYLGSYAYTSLFGNSWYMSNYQYKLTTQSVGFYNGSDGYSSTWANKGVDTTNSLYVSNSSWDCYDPTACHDNGEWWRFDTYSYTGSGWWMDTFKDEMNNGTWSNFNSSFSSDHGSWANVWDSTGGGETSPTPEPATYAMMGLGLAALGLIGRIKMKS